MLSTIQLRFAGLVALVLMTCHTVQAVGREEYAQVQARDLVKNPQFYWAQGIVFKDLIANAPTGAVLQLGTRQVIPFTTKEAGECYADLSVVSALQRVAPGTECIFSATVFQQTYWFKKSQFRIIVHEFSVSSTGTTDIRPGLSNLNTSATSGPYLLAAQRLDSILSQVQSELMAYSGESGTPMSEILKPEGPHRERTMNSIRGAIARTEEEMRAPASVFLADLLTAILASQYAPASEAAKVESAPAPTNAPPAVVAAPSSTAKVPDPKPAETPAVKPAPEKRSFFSRLFGSGGTKKAEATPPPPKPTKTKSAPAKTNAPSEKVSSPIPESKGPSASEPMLDANQALPAR